MLLDWNFWLSLITASVAVIALLQTAHQTKVGNKQHLFDRRLKAYMLAKGLVNLCKENYTQLQSKEDDNPLFANDLIFVWLTNNTYMEQQAGAIKHPLEQPYHVEFLKKCEELKELAEELQLYFNGKAAMQYSDFVSAYRNTLFSMYQYQITLCNMQEANKDHTMTLNEVQKCIDEPTHRKELYAALDNLKIAYDMLISENVEKKLRKQLTLR